MKRTECIISGQYLLPMDGRNTILENAGVAVDDDTIVAVGPRAELREKYPHADELRQEHGLIMPGLINTHTHAAMSCFRGLADDLPLMQWLQEYIFPREARLTGEMVYTSTLLSLCEMIRSGTTSFNDMYLFAADVARATDESGMRAWLGEVLYDFPSPSYGELENGFALMEQLFADYAENERITITVNPHAVYTCSPDLLTRLGDFAAERQALLHIHLAENQDEGALCRERFGVGPVGHLDKLGLLGERTLAAHCVVLDNEDIGLLARRGVKVAHCLESNMKLASGIAPVPAMLAAGVCVGIGTDGSASNNDVDMFGEMDCVAKVHKAVLKDPTVMDAETTLFAATCGGAAALGAQQKIGSLEVGKKADLIVVDFDRPHLSPVYHPVSHLVYAARGADVVHSMINGRLVMKNRKILTLDEPAILADMAEISRKIGSLQG
ncbi:MAG: S-adenosylhomocysteine deaminase [Desulfobulbus sp.]|nr:MAG: S-adenosylhomocysteine deaminase [Desulfobulbus sp.]